jgi:hypothetical protein
MFIGLEKSKLDLNCVTSTTSGIYLGGKIQHIFSINKIYGNRQVRYNHTYPYPQCLYHPKASCGIL